jgi:NTE family protein
MPRRPGGTAFVFAGGSALASIQVGMLRPLLAAGVRPDLIVGTSSGALNGAVTAIDPDSAPDTLERLWTTARRSDVLPVRAPTVLRALAGRSPGFASAGGIRQVIERHLTVRRIEDTAIPFYVVAADLATREKVVLDRGDVVDALVATTAIPGIYPPVRIGERLLADGGLAEDPPIATAVERGATTVYLFPVGWPLGPAPETGAVARALDALDWLFWRVAAAELARWAPECDLYVLPSPPITGLHPLSPESARQLIAAAEGLTREWLPHAATWRQRRSGETT